MKKLLWLILFSFGCFAFLPSHLNAFDCEDPNSCIVSLQYYDEITPSQDQDYFYYPYISNVGTASCSIPHNGTENSLETALAGTTYYHNYYKKYYWNGSQWNLLGSVSTASPYANGTLGELFVDTEYPCGCDFGCTDECANYETEIDFDGDGICDRCDFNPQDKDEGKYVWLAFNYYENDILVAQDYSIIPPADLINLPPEVGANYLYTAYDGDPDSDINFDLADVTFAQTPSAEMQPCACNVPCTLSTLPGSDMIAGDYEFSGTTYTPETPPEITLKGSTEERTFLTPDALGEHGTTTAGSGDPGAGQTDNAYLESIAGNQNTTAGNLDAIGNTLDAELNEIAGNTAQTSSNVAELVNGLGDPDAAFTSMSSAADSSLTGAVDILKGEITDLQSADNMSSSWFGGLTSSVDSLFVDGTCEPIESYISSIDKTITISCEFSDKLKIIFGFLLSVFTVIELVNILFTGISPKGSGEMKLMG